MILHIYYIQENRKGKLAKKVDDHYLRLERYEELKRARYDYYFYAKIIIDRVLYPGVYLGELNIHEIKKRKKKKKNYENHDSTEINLDVPISFYTVLKGPQKNLFQGCKLDVFFYGKVFFYPLVEQNSDNENQYFVFLRSKLQEIYYNEKLDNPYYYLKLTEKNLNQFECHLNERDSIKQKIYSLITNSSLRDEQKKIVLGLVFGNVNWADLELKNQFKELGLLHLFAASGLHLGILLGVLYLPLSKIFGKKHLITLVTPLPLLLFYLYLLEFSFSLVRAYIFLVIYVSQVLFQRKISSVETLINTLVIMILIFPLTVLNMSTALSFSAVGGIIFFYQELKEKLIQKDLFPEYNKIQKFKINLYNFILDQLLISITASIIVQPILYYFFKGNSVIGLWINIIFVPYIGFLLPFLFLVIFLSFLYSYHVSIINSVLDFLWSILKLCFDIISLFLEFMPKGKFYLSFENSLNLGFILSFIWALIMVFLIIQKEKIKKQKFFLIFIISTILYNLLIIIIFIYKFFNLNYLSYGTKVSLF